MDELARSIAADGGFERTPFNATLSL
jgi:hypothetical protein